MKIQMSRYFIGSLLVLVSSTNSLNAEETVYVSSKQANVYQEPNFNSELLGSLEQNNAVQLVQYEGLWVQVSNIKLKGWISRYSVTFSKPTVTAISISSRLINFFSGENKRDRLTLISTAGGVRGFSDDPNDPSGKKDFESVGKMESVKLTEAEVEKFVSSNSN